jgi:hypothetical protein
MMVYAVSTSHALHVVLAIFQKVYHHALFAIKMNVALKRLALIKMLDVMLAIN